LPSIWVPHSVQRFGQRLDVLDLPGDAVLQQGSDRVGHQRQPVQAGADDAERAVDPAAAAHALGDQLDVLGDPDAGPRARGLVEPPGDERLDDHVPRRAAAPRRSAAS
jgi:hypothetical protein